MMENHSLEETLQKIGKALSHRKRMCHEAFPGGGVHQWQAKPFPVWLSERPKINQHPEKFRPCRKTLRNIVSKMMEARPMPEACSWDVERTVKWLDQEVGLGEYADSFRVNQINGQCLHHLMEVKHLVGLKIRKVDHMNVIRREIRKLFGGLILEPRPYSIADFTDRSQWERYLSRRVQTPTKAPSYEAVLAESYPGYAYETSECFFTHMIQSDWDQGISPLEVARSQPPYSEFPPDSPK